MMKTQGRDVVLPVLTPICQIVVNDPRLLPQYHPRFDDQARTVFPLTVLGAHSGPTRASLAQQINAIPVGGGTNLSVGLFKGFEEFATHACQTRSTSSQFYVSGRNAQNVSFMSQLLGRIGQLTGEAAPQNVSGIGTGGQGLRPVQSVFLLTDGETRGLRCPYEVLTAQRLLNKHLHRMIVTFVFRGGGR